MPVSPTIVPITPQRLPSALSWLLQAQAVLTPSAEASSTTITDCAHRHCLWGYQREGKLQALAGLDVTRGELCVLYSNPGVGTATLKQLLDRMERAAAAYLLPTLKVKATQTATDFLRNYGYTQSGETLQKSLTQRHTQFQRHIAQLMQALEVPADYAIRHVLPVQPEPARLVGIGADIFDRPQRLRPGAAQAWRRMQRAALLEGIELQVVSAFRSVDYQCDIIRRKREQGLSSEAIFSVSAAPGFSEHHSGRALDLTAPDCPEVLTEAFADTLAYTWLCAHAHHFGFRESYPRDNPHQLTWEPWHWAWWPTMVTQQ